MCETGDKGPVSCVRLGRRDLSVCETGEKGPVFCVDLPVCRRRGDGWWWWWWCVCGGGGGGGGGAVELCGEKVWGWRLEVAVLV